MSDGKLTLYLDLEEAEIISDCLRQRDALLNKAITNAYKELTLTPEERQARRERSEKIKQEVKERLRKQGLIK